MPVRNKTRKLISQKNGLTWDCLRAADRETLNMRIVGEKHDRSPVTDAGMWPASPNYKSVRKWAENLT